MDKLTGVVVMVILVLVLFGAVFQGTLGGAIEDRGTDISDTLTTIDPDTAVVGN